MSTDIIIYCAYYKDELAVVARKDAVVVRVFGDKQEAEAWADGKINIEIHPMLIENVENRKSVALQKLSSVDKFLLGIS